MIHPNMGIGSALQQSLMPGKLVAPSNTSLVKLHRGRSGLMQSTAKILIYS